MLVQDVDRFMFSRHQLAGIAFALGLLWGLVIGAYMGTYLN